MPMKETGEVIFETKIKSSGWEVTKHINTIAFPVSKYTFLAGNAEQTVDKASIFFIAELGVRVLGL